MKRILIIVALMAISFSAVAQSSASVLKSLTKAQENAEHPKKSLKASTWVKLSEAYFSTYNFPKKDVWIGGNQSELKLVLGSQKVLSSESKVIAGVQYTIDTYEDKILYYNDNGVLDMVVITKPILEGDLVQESLNALEKAVELDVKGSEAKSIAAQYKRLHDEYVSGGMVDYTLGDVEKAFKSFETSLATTDNAVVKQIDSMIVYYTAVTANMSKQPEAAIKYFEKCKEIGYDQGGDVYGALAELFKAGGDIEKAKEYLKVGFSKYPTSQTILVSLINIHIENKDDPKVVLDLIRQAQENEPSNASLYYAEGNVYKNLGDIDNAVKCYWKSFEIDPNYIFGVYTIGSTYFDEAIKNQSEIDALDVNDYENYDRLLKLFEENLIKAIEPFEKAFAATTDKDFKVSIADGLKQIYFRFRDKTPEYQAGYEKYNQFLEENK